jgi:hypothetical protein
VRDETVDHRVAGGQDDLAARSTTPGRAKKLCAEGRITYAFGVALEVIS